MNYHFRSVDGSGTNPPPTVNYNTASDTKEH
jgi:hypothetical protein